MAELFAEEGIGETRIVRVEQGTITHAWLDWHETLIAGSRVRARIVQRKRQESRALAEADTGEAILIRNLPPQVSEGSAVIIQVLRAPIREAGRDKVGYHSIDVERLDLALKDETPRFGLWIDTTDLTVERTVDQIIERAAEAEV